jgi:hypothetical protein
MAKKEIRPADPGINVPADKDDEKFKSFVACRPIGNR